MGASYSAFIALLLKIYFYFCLCLFPSPPPLSVYVDQEWASDTLELELQVVGSHRMWVLGTEDSGRAAGAVSY